MNLVGLDIETTGTDINKGHRLIQIGIAFSNGHRFVADVLPTGNMVIDPEAMKINRFTDERIGVAQMQYEVDLAAAGWLKAQGATEGSLTPVGWNVGGFDMCFIKKELPLTAAFFSYRTLDLTGVAMTLELVSGVPYRDLKVEFHEIIKDRLGRDNRHDALYDAEAALIALELFRTKLGGVVEAQTH